MKNKTSIILLFLCCTFGLNAQNVNLIPKPQEISASGEMLEATAELQNQITKAFERKASTGAVVLVRDASLPAEGYTLHIYNKGVKITYGADAGLHNAKQTVLQLLILNEGKHLPYVTVKDYPQYEHRGLMLDVSRHFFSVKEVKKILKTMALYKLNRFHWHLTDDQGWRIEIPEYPKLTQVGAIRDSSLTNKGRQPFFYDNTTYGEGCFYTLDELREVVNYARSLNIEIIPEIDLPGHMVGAVASYPEFGCNPNKHHSVRVEQGVSKEVLNVGDDRVIDFLKCVLGHMAEVFPYQYIHLGGDECPTDEWKDNALCLKRVKDNNLKGVEELQSWLVEELGKYLKQEYGKDLVVWDELLAHWNDDNSMRPVIMCWRGLKFTKQSGDRGFRCISVPNYHNYLDLIQMPADKAEYDEVYQGGYGPKDVNTVEHIYRTNPVGEMTAGTETLCLGTQGNLWTESCSSDAQAEYQIFPRALAVAETGWLPNDKKDWDDFYTRLQSHTKVFNNLSLTYARHYFEQPEHPTQLDCIKAQMPRIVNGKTYHISSASNWYLARYAGSALYAKSDGALHLRYTSQCSDDELWRAQKRGNKVTFVNVAQPTVTFGPVKIEEATKSISYTVGSLSKQPATIDNSAQRGTVLLRNQSKQVLEANSDGSLKWGTDELIGHPATWVIEAR